ncbi:von Willebrand factor-like [Polyodon spathula]|uniref:von Willebrand factor-like n=1 Tax=Polyodon spathula TaxID=7913 RepID=UPI001B7E94D7|nr:von Willebrand factor-like [Polyodon spathula]
MEFYMERVLVWALVLQIIDWPSSALVSGKGNDALTGRCSLFGKDHIQTFDGNFYDFRGDCSYKLAGDCQKRSFSLLGDFQKGQRKSVSVYLGEFFEIHLFLDGTVTQGEKRLSLPYASSGIFIEMEAGYYKVSSEEYGFQMKIDNNGNIHTLLSTKHSNRTCGLCGNFNDVPEDDYMAQEGFLTENSYDFANSWALHGDGAPCKRVLPPSQTCNVSTETQEDPMSRCQILSSSSVFLKCAHIVDPEPFVSMCEDDTCHCHEGPECQCHAFLEYARTCAQRGVILKGWPAESHCRPQCPFGMEYNECISPCSHTCQSLHINEVCKEGCSDGCSCPAGKVLDGERCVDSSQCSCIHTGRRYPPGSSIAQDCNTCICRHGLWECSNEECPGECFVTGQSHFKSFDNKFFTFSGVCQYLFAKDCQDNEFAVVIETVQCADDQDAVCTRSATLRFHKLSNVTIKMKHGGAVSVNGLDIQTPLIQGPLRIQQTVMSSVRLTYNEDFQLDWDGRGKLLLKLSPAYSGKMCGLCGNYNGNQGDDFLTPAGLAEAQVGGFGNSWKINGECEDVTKQDLDPCSLNPKRVRYAEACSVLMSPDFEPCHYEVNPAPFVKNCRYDVCSCSDGKECLCSAVSSYATACARKGVLINWRTPDFCEMSCAEDHVYQQCGSPCNQTCRSLSFPDTACRELCMEGCYCPPGLYADDHGECVPRAQCACHYDGDVFQPGDVFSSHFTICSCEDGAMHCSSSDLPSAMLSDLLMNNLPSTRVRRSLSCRPPMMKSVCRSPREEGIECTKTCQNYDLECVSQGCISGCMCPPGWVRHRMRCVVPEQCPCFHNGREFRPGQTVSMDCNTCVCRDRKWECTNQVCDGSCKSIGEANYLTFDGVMYTFPGLCQYVLVQDYCNSNEGTFRILVENSGCGVQGQRCSKVTMVLYEGGVIELANGVVTMKKPVKDETEVEIIRSGLYFILLLGKGISVTWDLGTRVTVQLKGQYRNKVCGLCGNFDGVQNNDLQSSNNQVEVEPLDFGNSWKVNPGCAGAIQLPSQCSDNTMKLVSVEQSCNVLVSELFKECNKLVDPEPYWDICTYDTCSCPSVGDCVCFCDAVAAYAQECAQHGVLIHWRSNSLCPLSCDELNAAELEFACEWRYNVCAPACPITCQHPEPLECPLQCVEGCHANCPPGKILDEVAMKCIDPSQCRVCLHEGRRIAHGKKIILNRENENLCQICHCEGNNLSCEFCPLELVTTLAPTTFPVTTSYRDLVTTPVPENVCRRMMDLAFMVDGSSSLTEDDFETVKDFIINVAERFHMGAAYTRMTVMQFHTGIKSYEMQVQKPVFKKVVREMKYSGGEAAFINEALKYLALNIFDKDKREDASRVAVLLTASTSPRKIKGMLKLLSKKSITMISIGLGPYISMDQINQITSNSPSNKAVILSSVNELQENAEELTKYLCHLGQIPTVPLPKVTKSPKAPPTTTTTASSIISKTLVPLNAASSTTSSSTGPTTSASQAQIDVTFVVEGSDKVGEENFNITKEFLLKSIQKMSVGEKTFHITIIQYSYTITIEYSFTESQRKDDILEGIRRMEWRGGNATNTGAAVSETTLTTAQGSRDQVPDLVFLISSNPPSDTITKSAEHSQTKIIPIGVGPQVREVDLELIGHPQKPIIIKDYKDLLELGVTTVIETIRAIASPSLPATPTTAALHSTPVPTTMLPTSVPCDRPMDVIIMLEGSAGIPQPQFEEMKTFVKAFINKADIGANGTHLAVLQYGRSNSLEVSWVDRQNKESLLTSVNLMQQREAAPTRLGDALRFTVQSAVSEVHGGRPGVPKIAVLIVTRPSQDPVEEAAREALTAGVAVFPIGAGTQFDENQLVTMAGHAMKDNIIHLHRVEDLPTMVTLGNQFIDKLCRVGPPGVCVDDEGNERKPGETWTLSDQCHSLLCHPNGAVTIQNHKVNCEKMQKPACKNNLPSVKIQETCGCRWACPCMCMGSSTSHIVTFDGLAFKLTGSCSYTLLRDAAHGSDIILHNAPCPADPKQSCMKSIEVKHAGTSIALRDDMKVTVDGMETAAPFSSRGVEVTLYGALMHEVKIPSLGYVLTFTPGNNEFTVQLTPTLRTAKTSGLCGFCDQNDINDFALKDGSVTLESHVFIKEWTIQDSSGPSCEPVASLTCTHQASDQCLVLRSSMFQRCHAAVPPAPYIALCQETSCHGQDLCQVVAAYSHLCRLQGVCINWRSAGFCAQQCPSSMVFDSCKTGCIQQCASPFNSTLCMDTPTEGCFCPPGKVLDNGECVKEEACSQCLDENRVAHKHLESWIPEHDPCQICMCLDNRNINCTARPCSSTRAPVCGACEVLTKKKDSDQCCQEYECVCDLVSCDLPPLPTCADGMSVVLTNPGECKPVYECACKKEVCKLEPRPSCPPHRKFSTRETQCCDRYECTCNCVNSTVTCPPGYLSTSVTNDCGCTAISCLPDSVCVHHEVVYQVGSVWEEACKTCSCTDKQDKVTALHIVECTEKVCNEICPVGTSYTTKDGECCGKCKISACQEHSVGGPLADMDSGGRLRHVGERWRSAQNPCVISECVQVNDEVFINQQNLSCSQLDTPHCPPGTALQCDTFTDCCPSCHCAPMDGCVMNNTVIGSGETFLVDECTRCQCSVETGVIKRYRLLCGKVTCAPCQEGYRLEKVNGSCCGKCVATTCSFSLKDGTAIRLQAGEIREDGCTTSLCKVNERGDFVLETKVTSCPPFDKDKCAADGGKVVQLGKTCCETCAEPECKQTVGILKYIKIDDCMSENQVDIHYCEGKCSSKSIYSLEHHHVESHCVCCSATDTEPMVVPLRCANGTVLQHEVLNVKQCDCLSHACAGE